MYSARRRKTNGPPKRRHSPVKLRRLIDLHFDVVEDRSSGDEVTIICPEDGCPDRSGNRSINIVSGATNCWRCSSCNGSVFQLFRSQEIDASEVFTEFQIDSDADPFADDELDQAVESIEQSPEPGGHEVDLPQGFTALADDPTSVYAQMIGAMAVRKNLDFQAFADAGVGFTKIGDWEPFAIFPVYEFGKAVYYQGRTYAKRFEGGVTKKFPSKKQLPFGSSHWLYNWDSARQEDTSCLIVVESMLNVISLRRALSRHGIRGVVPVAVFKHKVSPPQLRKMLATPATELCFMFDGDATTSAWSDAQAISSYRKCSVATMPVGTDANDDAELAVARFLARSEYSSINALTASLESELSGL